MNHYSVRKFYSGLALSLISLNINAGTSCTPDNNTSFSDFENMAFRISNDSLGNNSLFSQCTDLSNELLLGQLDTCAPLPANPINGLGLNPTDKLLYGFSPTDALGIGTHLEMTFPFPSPGQPGDIMKADNADVYRIGNDGGFLRIGSIQPPSETVGLPADTHQVVPIVHSAASFDSNGNLFVLAYRTNYTSSADFPMATAEVLYQAPQIVIGEIDNLQLTSANGGNIPISWTNITMDSSCDAVVDKFKDDTNVFSTCVVDDYLMNGDQDAAVQNCLASTPILDKGIHDFAVSPVDGHYYGYDSMTFDDKDVLVDMNPMTNTASCTEIADIGNTTGVLNSILFSKLNKLVALFANQSTGAWIDVTNGTMTALVPTITSAPYGDGSSIPFAGILRPLNKDTGSDLIFKNGFEFNDPIFANGFEPPGFSSLDLDKSGIFVDANMDGFAQVGESINYSFIVSNTGTLDLNSLTISDPLMAVPGSLAELPVAAVDNSTFSGTYILTQNDVDNGLVSNIALANAIDSESNPLAVFSNGGNPHILNLNTLSALSLVKNGTFVDTNMDGFAQAGETIDYTFTVTNTGSVTLDNITITDPLIAVPGLLNSLAVGQTDNSTFSVSYVLTQQDVDNGSVSNTATANASDPANDAVTAQSNNEMTNLPSSPSISIVKTGSFVDNDNDGFAGIGDSIDYSFTVTNTGTQTLNNLTIIDPLFNVAGAIPTLAINSSDNSTLSGTYVLTQDDVNNGSVSNQATVNGFNPSNNPVTADSNLLVTNLPTSASIEITLLGAYVDVLNIGVVEAGDEVHYSITLTNTGTQTLNNLTITDGRSSVNADTLPTLDAGEIDNSTFSGIYTITQTDVNNMSVPNTATVSAFDPMNAPVNAQSNTVTPLTPVAGISLVKAGQFVDTNMDGLAQKDEVINYTFVVKNTGSLTLNTVTIDDPLMAVSGSLATLQVSATDNSTFTGTYVLTQDDVDDGFVANMATVNAFDPNPNPVSSDSNGGNDLITNLPTAASMSLTKTGLFNDESGDNFAQEGETIDYSFEVTNTGNLTLSNVMISDPLMNVPGSIASLAVATSDNATFSGTYVITQNDIDAGFVSNIATVSATDSLANNIMAQSNNGSLFTINLPTTASMSVDKTGVFVDTNMDGYAQVGETIDYSFTVTNTGNLTLSNVTISDPLMSVPGNIATLAVSISDNSTFSGTYVLTETDIENGMVSNLATANAADPLSNSVSQQSNDGNPLITNLPIFSCPEF